MERGGFRRGFSLFVYFVVFLLFCGLVWYVCSSYSPMLRSYAFCCSYVGVRASVGLDIVGVSSCIRPSFSGSGSGSGNAVLWVISYRFVHLKALCSAVLLTCLLFL